MALSTIEQLALAILQGDKSAQHSLLDEMIERGPTGGILIPPVNRTVTCTRDRLRIIVFMDKDRYEEMEIDNVSLIRAINRWLDGEPLTLIGIERVELYELPENFMEKNQCLS